MKWVNRSFSYPGVLTEWACSQANKPSPVIPQEWLASPYDKQGVLLYGRLMFSAMQFCPQHLPSLISIFYSSQNKDTAINDIFIYFKNSDINRYLCLEMSKKIVGEKTILFFIDMLKVRDHLNSFGNSSRIMLMFLNYFIENKNKEIISEMIKSSSSPHTLREVMDCFLAQKPFSIDFGCMKEKIEMSVTNHFDFHQVIQAVFSKWFDAVSAELEFAEIYKLKLLDYIFSTYPKNKIGKKDFNTISSFFINDFNYNNPSLPIPNIKAFMQKETIRSSLDGLAEKKEKTRLI